MPMMINPLSWCLEKRDKTPPPGHVVWLNGISSAGKTTTYKNFATLRGAAVRRIHSNDKYAPNDTVPLKKRYPNTRQRARRLSEAAVGLAAAGETVVVDFNDYWHAYMNDAALALHGNNVMATSLLLYVELPDIIKRTAGRNSNAKGKKIGEGGEEVRGCWASLVEFGVMFTGTPDKQKASLSYLSQDQLLSVLGSAQKEESLDRRDVEVMYTMARDFLTRTLGLGAKGEDGKTVKGVWIQPRWDYDLVINTSSATPNKVAAALAAHCKEVEANCTPSIMTQQAEKLKLLREEYGDSVYHQPHCQYCYYAAKKANIDIAQDPNVRPNLNVPICGLCLNTMADILKKEAEFPVAPDMSSYSHS